MIPPLSMLLGSVLALGASAPNDGVLTPSGPSDPSELHDRGVLRQTIYLNFNGGMLYFPLNKLLFDENAAENASFLVAEPGVQWPVYGSSEQTAVSVAQAVAADFEPFGVRIVYLERPPARLPYTMVMVGGDADLIDAGNHNGIALIDCEVANMRHVAYAFNDEDSVLEQANIISHEIGHTMGLEHAQGSDELMSYAGNASDKVFTGGCRDYCIDGCGGGVPYCTDRHEQFCDPGYQDAAAELLHLFGTNEPDLEAPTVTFSTPTDGETIPFGDDIPIEASIEDDFGNFGWQMRIEHDGEVIYDEPDYSGIPSWFLAQPAIGAYAITVTAQDHADHVTEATVTVDVVDPLADDGSSSGYTGTSDESTSGAESGSTGTDTAPQSGPAATDGCGCRHQDDDTPGSLLLLLGLLAARGAVTRRRGFFSKSESF